MGLFADIRAAKDVLRIKNGGFASLSISQITNLIINLPDAKKNLPADQFDKVYSLFKELRKCSTPVKMDFEGYIDTAVKIIRRFDAIAPYEKYSGGNELESSFMMEDIRQNTPILKQTTNAIDSITLEENDKEYVDYIIQSASNYHISIPRYEAETIAKIITIYHTVGETVALQTFDSFVSGIIESYTDSTAMTASMRIPFYTGLLITNGVLNETEAAMYNDMALERQIQFLKEHGKIEN